MTPLDRPARRPSAWGHQAVGLDLGFGSKYQESKESVSPGTASKSSRSRLSRATAARFVIGEVLLTTINDAQVPQYREVLFEFRGPVVDRIP